MKSIYDVAAARVGKDPASLKRHIEREGMFPDLVELAQDEGDDAAVNVLTDIARCNPRVRNTDA